MAETSLRGRQVLVVEDEYILAEDLHRTLEEAGAIVLGPVPSVADAIALIEAEPEIDGAVLDLNLDGEMVFPVADMLAEREIPFVFTTGYEAWNVPARFANATRCEKPVEAGKLARVLSREMAG